MSIDEAELIEYWLCTLEPGRAREVEAAAEADPRVARALADIAEALAAVGEASPPVAASPGLRERVVGSVVPERRLDGFAARLARLFDIDMDTALDALAKALKAPAGPWVRTPVPGVYSLAVRRKATAGAPGCSLVYLARGAAIPRHRHRGEEHMLVLDGYAEEDSGRRIGPGDEVISAPGSGHGFDILADTPCLVAIRLERGLDWVRWQDKAVFAWNALVNRLRPDR